MLLTHDAVEPVVLALHRGQRIVQRHPARFRVLVTGRRWGKTTLGRAEAVAEFGTPGTIWYLAPTYDMARELMWEPIRHLVPSAWLIRAPHETRMELETLWGCKFACKSVEHPDRLRGRGPRKLICDEFQDWKDGWRIWEEVLMPSLLTSNGRALFTGTPKSFNHLYKAFEFGQNQSTELSDWASWQFTTASAPHIPTDYLARMQAQMDPRSYRQEFEASFETIAGRAYYAFSRAHNVGPVLLEPQWPVCLFFDFNVEPATAGIGQRQGDRACIYREVKIRHAGGEATRATARRVKELLREAHHVGSVRIYGDATGRSAKTTGPADHAVLREIFPGAIWCIGASNPHEKDRVEAVNSICTSMQGLHRLCVDPANIALIADLEQVIFSDNGELDKKSNPELTHISDALGYWLAKDFPPAPKTRAGAMSVDWIS
jgi:hypothetical protein